MADVKRPSMAPPGAPAGGEWLTEESESARKEGQARAKLASDVTIALERTLKSFRQFGVRHKTSEGFVLDANNRAGIFVDAYGELPLSIVGTDVLYDGESIYSDQELRTSYPFLLFRDGVQRVVFEEGLVADEVRTFCTLLRDQSLLGNGVQLEDDLVTLLWDADLQHVRYVVSESFKQEDVDADREEARKQLIEKLKIEAFRPRIEADVSARFVRSRPQEEKRAQEDLAVAAAWERGNQILGDERARKALAATVDDDDTLLRKFLEIVFGEILGKADEKTRLDLVGLVRDFAVEATRRDRLPEAIGVLRALGDLAKHAGAEGRKVAQEILGSIATPEVLAEVMHQLEIADEAGTEQLLTFLALMPANESRRIVPLLPTVTTSSRRRALCQLLAARLGDDLGSIGEQVRDADEPLALDLVFLLKSSSSARARVELLVALDSSITAIRRAAFDVLRATTATFDPTLLGAALLGLEDPDPEMRRRALTALPRQIDSEVARRLRMIIGRDSFDAWDYYDKRRAFLAYAAAAGPQRAVKELVEVLGQRGLFSSDALEDRRCAAAIALASLGDENQLPVIEGEGKRLFAGKRIKEACEAAVAMLKFKRPLEGDAKASVAPPPNDDVDVIDTRHLPPPIWDDGILAAPQPTARGLERQATRRPRTP
jgi:hypothetical protein